MSGPRNSERASVSGVRTEPKLVEAANALSADAFFAKFYAAPAQLTEPEVSLVSCDAEGASRRGLLMPCLRLVEESSRLDYERSALKWSTASKTREMKLPDMKYLVLQEKRGGERSSSPVLAGFASFMITYEDGREVVYLYEIHLAQRWQGKGIGKILLGSIEQIGSAVGVAVSMLTVFKANQRALNWYTALGYAVDDFSPEPRVLRNGTVKEPGYLILSKVL